MSLTVPTTSTLAAPPNYQPVFNETEDTVRARLLSNLPDGLSTDEGSFPRDFLEICVAESVRKWAMLDAMLAQQYVWWASGQRLDALAAQYGIERGAGTVAVGNLRFTAPAGTPIPPATQGQVPQEDPNADELKYTTTNVVSVVMPAAGYVDVPAQSNAVGQEYNQPLGTVTLLASQADGVTALANSTAMTQGSDPDTDDVLRGKVLAQAALPVGSGTPTDYVAYGLGVAGVGDVAVYPIWDTSGNPQGSGNPNGSILLSLRDPSLVPVDYSVVQAAQIAIDPMREMLAMFEDGEGWQVSTGAAALGADTVHKQLGYAATSLAFAAAGSTLITLARGLDLSRFGPVDDIYLWVYATNWADVTPAGCTLALADDTGDYYQAPFTELSAQTGPNYPAATPAPVSGAGWWLWRVSPEQFAITGTPVWSGINQIALQIEASAAVTVTLDYLVQRALTSGTTGKGQAPVGAAATVITPSFLDVTVVITDLSMAPGYALSDAPGTTNLLTALTIALNAFFLGLRPGAPIRVNDLIDAIVQTPGVIDFTLAQPTVNILPPPSQYAQLNANTFSVTT